ncbi:MAG: hypothetical protein IT162_02210 [Bryobacterales bacterium]|nr:hypothetical protein [Bryobacterales bacterium]
MTVRRRLAQRSESGFVLLLIFAMAASIGVLLYKEMPRVMFEAQRNKEELLIERGEQYKRAIQVYYRKNKKLPQRVEDLERGSETRFLRRRYKDPFTGKDDWKFIETDGVSLKNSLVKKPQNQLGGSGRPGDPQQPQAQQGSQPASGFTSFGMPAAQPGVPGQPPQQPCLPGQPGCEPNPALQRRGSDRPAVSAGQGDGQAAGGGLPACDPTQAYDPTKCDPSKPWDPQAAANQQQQQQQQPGAPPPPGMIPGQPGYPGQPAIPGQPSPYPGQVYPTGPGGMPAQPGYPAGIPGIPGFPGASPGGGVVPRPSVGVPPPGGYAPVNSQTGGAAPGAAFPGQNASALAAINQLLTTPRQGGMPGAAAGAAMGPGIVGVASKHEGPGIKVYAERTKYQEWEFVYDPKEEKAPNMSGNAQPPGANSGQPGNPLGSSTPPSPNPASPMSPGMGGGFPGRQR